MDDLSRQRLVVRTDHLLARGIVDADVLEAMRSAPRRRLVPAGARAYADADRPSRSRTEPPSAGRTSSPR